MRIVFVAGFFKHVLPELERRAQAHLKSGAVVWVPPYGRTEEPNLNRLKGSFLDVVNRGATEILLCLFVMRGKEQLTEVIQAIVAEGYARSKDLKVRIELFKSARDAEGVLSKISEFNPSAEPPLPSGLDGFEGWVKQKHDGRVIIHPRAVDGARDSQYEDEELIFKAIDYLGTEYWNMRTAEPERAAEHRALHIAKLQELGLELSQSISESRAGEEGDTYFVRHPPGTDKKRMLEYHLKKGADRDPRFCLRIYFFWDEDSTSVVVGWLPNHLETRSS